MCYKEHVAFSVLLLRYSYYLCPGLLTGIEEVLINSGGKAMGFFHGLLPFDWSVGPWISVLGFDWLLTLECFRSVRFDSVRSLKLHS